MKVTFADGTELEALGVHGRSVEYQGVRRDCLTFLFDPELVTLSQAAAAFTPERCGSITLADEAGSYVHEHYTIRVEAGQGIQSYVLTGVANDQEPQESVYVRMAQSTLAEREIMEQRALINKLLAAGEAGGHV